jgi:DNA-binding MarR family transcriptional regulator
MQESKKTESIVPTSELYQHQVPTFEDSSLQSTSIGYLKDHIDWIIEGWHKERPDLDIAPIAIINRLERLQAFLRPEVATVFERFGLTAPSFAVIATLRRAGKPYQLSQRALMDSLQLTGGTISVRIDRLERDGIVERAHDPHDQRGVLVRLTETGKYLFDQVASLHLANEDRLLSALNTEQREQLAALLRILLLSFDRIDSEDPQHPSGLIGVSLASAHNARKIRRASGLPDVIGLLVQNVAIPSPAADAGLQEGDLIVSANETEIRSIENLHQQLLAAHGERITLEILRGSEHRTVYLSMDTPSSAN